ncbi:pilin, partial [Patescibacteria group bacterium]|nr:pilin [Patescibacteria group bacterium]
IILIIFLAFPTISLALELDYPVIQNLEIKLDMNLNELVVWFYYFIVGISGLAAFSMFVWGGFDWLTSAGNSSGIGRAKEKINSAVLGLIIILTSWLILQLINPELTIIKLPTL